MRRFSLVFALVALSVWAAPTASADPTAETFDLECEGVPGGTITANSGNGIWTPGFATASTGVYIPYSFEFDATFTEEGGEPVELPLQVFTKRAPKNTRAHAHGVCTFGGEVQLVDDPDLGTGLLEFSATTQVFWTGD